MGLFLKYFYDNDTTRNSQFKGICILVRNYHGVIFGTLLLIRNLAMNTFLLCVHFYFKIYNFLAWSGKCNDLFNAEKNIIYIALNFISVLCILIVYVRYVYYILLTKNILYQQVNILSKNFLTISLK